MNTQLITPEHVEAFNSTMDFWVEYAFDFGFDRFVLIVGIAVFCIIIKVLINKLG